MSAEEYLERELTNRDLYEYVGGVAHMKEGSSQDHSEIVGNLIAALRPIVRGGPCHLFATNFKVRLQLGGAVVFYYPDVMVACDAQDADPYYSSFPKLIIEVLSPDTEQIDRREKFLSFIQIGTLQEYVLVAQDRMEVTVFRRANKWQPEVVRRADESLSLNSLEFSMPLPAIYEGVEL